MSERKPDKWDDLTVAAVLLLLVVVCVVVLYSFLSRIF